jgi:hypothetical protein
MVAGPDQTANEGDLVSLSPATFNDKGTSDTHTATIDWGDGTGVEAAVVAEIPFGPPGSTAGADGTVSGSHVYADDGAYTVTVCVDDDDGAAACDSLIVTVLNVAPVAVENLYSTDEDTSLTVAAPGVLGNDSDVDGDALTAVLVAAPGNGTLTFNTDGSFLYIPNSNFNGSDSFTYKANDGTVDSNIATVTITINALPEDTDGDGIIDSVDNCPSIPNADQSNLDNQDGGDVCDVCPNDDTDTCDTTMSGGGSVDAGGGDVSNSDESVNIAIPPGALDDPTSISITDSGNGSIFELTTNLGNGTALFQVNIQPEGTVFGVPITITFSWDDADNNGKIDGTNIQEDNVRITKDNVVVTEQCKFETGPLSVTGAECDTVANTFSFQVDSLSDYTLFVLNQPPVADAGPDQTIEGTSPTGTLITLDASASNDPDGDAINCTWTGDFPEGGGTVTGCNPTVTLPLGTSTITLVVNDGQLDSEPDTVSVTVTVGVEGLLPPLAALVPDGEEVPYPDKAFKKGRTLPLKLEMYTGGTVLSDTDTTAPHIVSLVYMGVNTQNIETIDLDAGESNDSGLSFRYDNSTWIYNLSSKGLRSGQYQITLEMPDEQLWTTGFILK